MKKNTLLMVAAGLVVLSVLSLSMRRAQGREATAAVAANVVAPIVFQASGPSVASIQGSVDEYRRALGDPNNRNDGPKDTGRREINWDGVAQNKDTAAGGNPLPNFLVTRGALFTTPDGSGFVQATPEGLAAFFGKPKYATIFRAFSQFRLFSAIGGRITDVDFFVPGGGNIHATTKGFGAVFTDINEPDRSGGSDKHGHRDSSVLIEYFGKNGELLFSSFVPAAPRNGGQSFFGVIFPDTRIARVRITSGNAVPGADDNRKQDVVMMDDFIYGEPKAIQ